MPTLVSLGCGGLIFMVSMLVAMMVARPAIPMLFRTS